jgi:ABC-type branched-subunit amino acid transport system substrate-binding protein
VGEDPAATEEPAEPEEPEPTEAPEETAMEAPESIKVGAVVPLTGPFAGGGAQVERGYNMAVADSMRLEAFRSKPMTNRFRSN